MNRSIWKRLLNTEYGVRLGIGILLQGCVTALMSPLVPIIISQEIGLNKREVMIYFLASTLVGIVITLGTGWLSDGHIPRYRLVLIGGITATIGIMLLSQATHPIHAWVAGVLISGIGVIFPQLFAVAKAGVVNGWEHEAQVMGISALRTMFSLGFVLGTAVTSLLAKLDTRSVFLMGSGVILLLTIFQANLLRRMEVFIARQETTASALPQQATAARGKDLPLWVLIVPLLTLLVLRGADSTRGTYLALVMFQLFKDASIAPLMFGITAAVELITLGLMSYLASRIGEKYTICIGAGAGAIYYTILSFSQSLPLLYAAHVLYAVFAGAMLGVAMAYVQSLMAHRAGMGGSVYTAIFSTGSLIGIILPQLVVGYDQTIFVAPIFLCMGGAVLLLVGDRSQEMLYRMETKKAHEKLSTARSTR